MAFRALRSIIRPVSQTILSTPSSSAKLRPIVGIFSAADLPLCRQFASSPGNLSFFQPAPAFDRLTDTRLPKRRPKLKSRKRTAPKPTGAAAWAKYLPMDKGNGSETVEEDEKPKKKSAKRINEKKRLKLQRAFILSEKKKRTALVSAAKRKKEIERVERKMAAVAREREWAQRLVELQQMEKEKEKKAALA